MVTSERYNTAKLLDQYTHENNIREDQNLVLREKVGNLAGIEGQVATLMREVGY